MEPIRMVCLWHSGHLGRHALCQRKEFLLGANSMIPLAKMLMGSKTVAKECTSRRCIPTANDRCTYQGSMEHASMDVVPQGQRYGGIFDGPSPEAFLWVLSSVFLKNGQSVWASSSIVATHWSRLKKVLGQDFTSESFLEVTTDSHSRVQV